MAYAVLRRSDDQSISDSNLTSVTWDTEDVDSGSIHSGSNATVSLPEGVYLLIAIISWQSNSSGYRLIQITCT